MKKKIQKITAFLIAIALIIGLGVFANALVGNPVSKMLATQTANKHLAKNYANTDFFIERVKYDFKGGYYYAHIKSARSIDSYFSLYLGMDGKLERDSYEEQVVCGSNTARRLNKAYRSLTDSVLENPKFPFTSDIAFGDLEFVPRDYALNEDVPTYAIVEDDLELDQLYDIPKLGAKAGHLVIYVDDEIVTVERAAEIMLEIKRLMDAGGAPFYAMDFVLQYPKSENEGSRREERVETINFLYVDIYEAGMNERVRAANDDAIAYHALLDAKKR